MTEPSSATEEHYPEQKDPQGHIRCSCGYRWPCPTARSGPRPLTAEEWDLLRSLELDVGFAVWQRSPFGVDPGDPEGPVPVGGVIVGSYTDDDGATVFRVLDFPRGRHRYTRLRLADLEPATVHLPNPTFIRSAARKLAATVGKAKGTASGEELELLADAVVLLRSIT